MKHWVFDLDGTLVDSFAHYFSLLSDVFEKRGVQFDQTHRMPALTDTLPALLGRHLKPGEVRSALDEIQERSNEDAQSIRAFDGIPELLTNLRKNGARVAVCTNRDLVSASLILRHSGLEPLIETCVSGTCVERRKPHPEGLFRIMREFSCRPSDVTMVGDHEHDVLAAQGAGVRSVRASWHDYWPAERCAKAQHQFHHLPTFVAWASERP